MKKNAVTEITVIKARKGIITTPNNSNVYVMLPERGEIHVLNETAAYLWNLSRKGIISINKMIDLFVSEYDVTRTNAKKDVLNFVELYMRKEIFSIVEKQKTVYKKFSNRNKRR